MSGVRTRSRHASTHADRGGIFKNIFLRLKDCKVSNYNNVERKSIGKRFLIYNPTTEFGELAMNFIQQKMFKRPASANRHFIRKE